MQTKPTPLAPMDRFMLAATELKMAAERNMDLMEELQEELPILTDSDVLAAAENWTTSRLDLDGSFRDYEGLRDTLFSWVMEAQG
jgi:hypothetical protein